MTALTFAPATKKALKARIALEGPSGSGKTFTALTLAQALGERIAVVDTERQSASLYADLFRFDTLNLDRFAPEVLIDALAAAASHDVCCVDSFSHFWMGQDGMLEQVDRAAKRSSGGNTFGGWKDMRPIERKMIDAMLAYPGHLIVTLRTKSEWVVEENDRGKKVPKKIGLKAEQREGLEYEFTVVGTLDLENTLVVTKSRCPAVSGAVITKPDAAFAITLLNWLDDGETAGTSAVQLRDEILADVNATRDDFLAYYQRAREGGLLATAIVDELGDTLLLSEWIVARGKAVAAAANPDPAPAPPAASTAPDPMDDWAAEEAAPAFPAPGVTDVQHRTMHAVWRELGYAGDENRDNRLTIIRKIIRRDIASSKELTEAEADGVIEALNSKKRELKAAAKASPGPAPSTDGPATAEQRKAIIAGLADRGITRPSEMLTFVNEAIAPARVANARELTEFTAAQVLGVLAGDLENGVVNSAVGGTP